MIPLTTTDGDAVIADFHNQWLLPPSTLVALTGYAIINYRSVAAPRGRHTVFWKISLFVSLF